ncbi:hypothetical protein HPP92_019598 [Vanilla planifolia]|uniref:Uncharacterized protein n=1 Tax=Vanilla planifolia TaxID=51239 RepID=A0A835Q5P0_VANPL|nr:hypothetical protein HPP92_019598 [Vanilla planifolia]
MWWLPGRRQERKQAQGTVIRQRPEDSMEEIAGGKHDQVVEEEQVEPTLWSWGAGSDGQLATGTLEDQSLPQPLSFPSVHPIFRMACGGAHAIALTRNLLFVIFGPFVTEFFHLLPVDV